MSKIIDNKLFLGDKFDANNDRELKEKGITCIICVAEDVEIKLENKNIKVHKYNLQDNYNCNISLYFDEITDIIENENIVLVNCAAGISRSSTIVIAYLMKYFDISLMDALLYVRNKRSFICPNKRFLKYLFDYEKKIFDKNNASWDDLVKVCFYS